MNQTCDRCGPAVRAAYRADRGGELYLCGHCISQLWTTTRKVLGERQDTGQPRPFGFGFFFSLGHSTIVVAIGVGIIVAGKTVFTAVSNSSSGLEQFGGLFGTVVSASFLFLIGLLNLVMTVMDTTDGLFMNLAYGWAFFNPVRKVYWLRCSSGGSAGSRNDGPPICSPSRRGTTNPDYTGTRTRAATTALHHHGANRWEWGSHHHALPWVPIDKGHPAVYNHPDHPVRARPGPPL
jgi:hypothetical protein